MEIKDYMLRVERNSHHYRDDWGIESDSYSYLDADLEGLKVGDRLKPLDYLGEGYPRRSSPQTYLDCLKIEDDRLTFRFFFLENYRGTEITIAPNQPALAGGSTDRSSAYYTILLIPKTEYQPRKEHIEYK